MSQKELEHFLEIQKNLRNDENHSTFIHGGTEWVIEKTSNQFPTLYYGSNNEGWLGGVAARRVIEQGSVRASYKTTEDKVFFLLFTNVLNFPDYAPKITNVVVQHQIIEATSSKTDKELANVLTKTANSLFDNSLSNRLSQGTGV